MKRSRAWVRFGVPLLALGVLLAVAKWTTPEEESVARITASAPEAPLPGEFPEDEMLAESVRYSEPFHVERRTRLQVRLEGRGSVHVALVSNDDGPAHVREAFGEAPGEIRFAALEAGDWVMRLRALPGGSDLAAEARVGGQSWTLLAAAAGLLFLPFVWPYRRAPVTTWRRFMSTER